MEAVRSTPGDSAKLYESIFENLREGIIVADRELRVSLFNRAAMDMTGYAEQEMIGRLCTEILDRKLCGERCFIAETRDTGRGISDYQVNLTRKDGTDRAISFTTAPLINGDEVEGVIIAFRDVTELVQLKQEVSERYQVHSIVTRNREMRRILNLVEQAADTPAPVLITGETGTGKELLAKAIHYASGRSNGPFVAVSCAALAENLLESELFGHVKGAFTGAIRDKAGRIALAEKGTLFLDEIGDLSPVLQVKLLRVLQEYEYEPVGESRTRKADVRLVAATNRDLETAIAEGRFREDLYYRLRVVPIHLPPLRERTEDIPLLVEHFIGKLRKRYKKNIRSIAKDAMAALVSYSWAGNIRELEHAVEFAFVRCPHEVIGKSHLPEEIFRAPNLPFQKKRIEFKSLPAHEQDKRMREALEKTRGNKTQAARLLGISRVTLWQRLKAGTPGSEPSP
ncbi:MAG: sigma 54-interacting transcriptional regulator [Nitrospirae bacterium]|nr:sigma 54-interacting transcriptional regulator [Nitrospirota bacterium]